MIRGLAIAAVLGGAALGAARLVGGTAARVDDVATYTVARQAFVRRVTAEGNLRAVKATQITAPRSSSGRMGAMKIAWLAPDGIRVKAGEVVVRFDPSEPEKQLRDGEADLEAAQARLRQEAVKAGAAVAGRDRDAALAGDELERTRRFQARDPEIFSRNQIIESEIDEGLAGAKQAHADRAKQIERHRSRSNAAVIGVERQKAELAISHAQAALHGMAIVAPTDGIFVLARDWRGAMPKLGDSLWPGQAVAEIPILVAMEAAVYVLEIDGTGLAEGQPAEVEIEARPDQRFHGKIRLVDKLAQPRQPGSPVQYFGVVVAFDATDPAVMKPGQRVRAGLLIDQEDALVVPRQAVADAGGRPVVHRRAGAGWEVVPVELGAATAGRVVIKRGLAAGDVIALRDPDRAPDAAGSGAGSAAGQAGAP
jgi:HlyD family secretion protein